MIAYYLRTFILALTIAFGGTARAAVVLYDFQDFWGDILAPASVPAHMTVSKVSISNSWGSICWNTDLGVTDDFACGGFGSSTLSFSLSAQSGFQFDINEFAFQGLGTLADGSAPTSFAIFSSLDGFSSALISGSLTGQVTGQRYDFDTAFSAVDLTTLEFRIVTSGRDDLPASAWLVDNLRLDTTVEAINAVPEPGSMALMVFLMLLAMPWRGRRR